MTYLNPTSYGEVRCPRKGTPFAAVIAVSVCETMHMSNAARCAELECKNHVAAKEEVISIRRALSKDKDSEDAKPARPTKAAKQRHSAIAQEMVESDFHG